MSHLTGRRVEKLKPAEHPKAHHNRKQSKLPDAKPKEGPVHEATLFPRDAYGTNWDIANPKKSSVNREGAWQAQAPQTPPPSMDFSTRLHRPRSWRSQCARFPKKNIDNSVW